MNHSNRIMNESDIQYQISRMKQIYRILVVNETDIQYPHREWNKYAVSNRDWLKYTVFESWMYPIYTIQLVNESNIQYWNLKWIKYRGWIKYTVAVFESRINPIYNLHINTLPISALWLYICQFRFEYVSSYCDDEGNQSPGSTIAKKRHILHSDI